MDMPANPNYVTAHVTPEARSELKGLTFDVTSPQGRQINMAEALMAAVRTAREHPEDLHRHLDQILDEKIDGRRTPNKDRAAA